MVNQGGVEMRIAIIEDDEITRLELSKLLNTQGYETVLLTDFGNLTDELKQYSIELVLLDINLPYENGYEVCRKIKQVMPVPIIFVTSRDTNADELKSIQVGGIDFITKPYDTLILLEKIKRALQLSNPNNFRELVKKDCTLDLHLSILKYQEQSIELTRNEFRILYYFFMNEDKVISKEELLEKLWNDKYYLDENVLLVNMTRLKKKMKEIPHSLNTCSAAILTVTKAACVYSVLSRRSFFSKHNFRISSDNNSDAISNMSFAVLLFS